uniref:CSON001468 protein n=1 Tax=Culicoides sonorensis TaxID=179676 RepID=A0A336L7K0_CULSO
MWKSIILFSILMSTVIVDAKKVRQEIFEQDLGDAFKIAPSTEGLAKVHLKCGADSMHITLETEEDFHGVLYTRGSFYKQSEPCFVKPKGVKGERTLRMKFPLTQCQTVQSGDLYSNVIVVQHDPELITPGDSAFTVECDFRKPRSFNVEASMNARDSKKATGSRISLANPDPSASETEEYIIRAKRSTASSESDSVTFIPDKEFKNQEDGSGEGPKVIGTVEEIKFEIKDEL